MVQIAPRHDKRGLHDLPTCHRAQEVGGESKDEGVYNTITVKRAST